MNGRGEGAALAVIVQQLDVEVEPEPSPAVAGSAAAPESPVQSFCVQLALQLLAADRRRRELVD